jgi:hypothetical protein
MEDTNMKKIYVNPELNVIRIATQHMIATSGPLVGGTTSEVDDLLSREADFELEADFEDDFDDLEEEDF